MFIGYFKTGDREGVRATPQTPPPSESATAFDGELAKLRCGDFFFLPKNLQYDHVNTCQYNHYNTCQKISLSTL